MRYQVNSCFSQTNNFDPLTLVSMVLSTGTQAYMADKQNATALDMQSKQLTADTYNQILNEKAAADNYIYDLKSKKIIQRTAIILIVGLIFILSIFLIFKHK